MGGPALSGCVDRVPGVNPGGELDLRWVAPGRPASGEGEPNSATLQRPWGEAALFLLEMGAAADELRQAIVAMMNRKDELEEENRSLRNLLDGEMEHSAALRQEVDTLKRKVTEQEERHTMKVQALASQLVLSGCPCCCQLQRGSVSPHDSVCTYELRQAIVAMMNRKDELEEENRYRASQSVLIFLRSLRNLLDGEMEHSAALRQEVDTLKRKVTEQEERHTMKVQALARENEVLKVQLKKYVGAVQMLKREGPTAEVVPNLWNVDGEVTVPEQKPGEVAEELASSYERKLIEVAEMHGELIEFNERLHRALVAKEALVSQMRQELIDLRGPVPGDLSQTSEDQSLSDFEISNRALINVWIPSVFLRGKAANAFHVYQVYIRIKDDEWNVYRRYTEFRSLHHKLQSRFPQVRAYSFPPKKAIGNKDAKFVEERRKQLQSYLRSVMNKVIQMVPEFAASPKKETLTQLMPFFVDITPPGEPLNKNSRPKAASRFPKLSRGHPREMRNVEPQSGDL
ncbi:Hypothetical predicted protein [Marmota monax]|uniref:PX domain-containing protein n=1 Tax=Marmota monax TaxID=9995 RepID=A0A5E4C8B2_MARMO|nr:Hypothetical predicted protein [Marmota monax]